METLQDLVNAYVRGRAGSTLPSHSPPHLLPVAVDVRIPGWVLVAAKLMRLCATIKPPRNAAPGQPSPIGIATAIGGVRSYPSISFLDSPPDPSDRLSDPYASPRPGSRRALPSGRDRQRLLQPRAGPRGSPGRQCSSHSALSGIISPPHSFPLPSLSPQMR